MKQSFRNRVVVVTGASAGVGRATVREFALNGADVGLIARGRDGLAAARAEVERLGRRAVAISCDVADADSVESAAAAIEGALGPIDVWVNCAMTSVFAPFAEIKPDEYRRVTEVTYLGYVNGTRAALRRMRARDRGTIVQVGSALAYRAIPLQSAYCASKFAIRGFTDSLRCELRHDRSKVHLTMVQLPAVNTPQFDWERTRLKHRTQPVPPIYQPEVPARAIVWAAAHRRREVFVGGSTVAVILGNKLFPRLADWYLGKTGYQSQQTSEPQPADQPDNLFHPLPGDHGAHGRFDQQARRSSLQQWLSKHRGSLLAGALLVGTLAGRERRKAA